MSEVSQSVPGPVAEADSRRWWHGPRKVVRAVLSGLNRGATVVCNLLSYGSH